MPRSPRARACAALAPCSPAGVCKGQSRRREGAPGAGLGLQWLGLGIGCSGGGLGSAVERAPR